MTRAELIEALETAQGADRGLFEAAFDLTFPVPDSGRSPDDGFGWAAMTAKNPAFLAWCNVKQAFNALLDIGTEEAFLGAAMMLLSAGWMVAHLSEFGAAGGCVCSLGNPATSQEAVSDHGARTLALALAAACLRAGGE